MLEELCVGTSLTYLVEPTGVTEKAVQAVMRKSVSLKVLVLPQKLLVSLNLGSSGKCETGHPITDKHLEMLPDNYPALTNLQLRTIDNQFRGQ